MAQTPSGRTLLKPGEPEKLEDSVPKKDLLALCMAAGIKWIWIQFDGQGDSGQIEDIKAFDKKLAVKNEERHEILKAHEIELHDGIKKTLDAIGYLILEKFCPGDWVNNDGGYGVIHINVAHDAEVTLEYYQRISDVEEHIVEIPVDALAMEREER